MQFSHILHLPITTIILKELPGCGNRVNYVEGMFAAGILMPLGETDATGRRYETFRAGLSLQMVPCRTSTRIFHAFEMFIGKAAGALLYECYRKPLITRPMGISSTPAG